MNDASQRLISEFNSLSKDSQKEVLVSLLRLPIEASYPTPDDDELRYAADAIFLELDRREAAS